MGGDIVSASADRSHICGSGVLGGRAGMPLTAKQLAGLLTRLANEPDAWSPRLLLPESGQKWWTRLASDPCVDVWFLSWLPGHSTDLHDHGGSAAACTVVHGELTEVRIAPNSACVRIPPHGGVNDHSRCQRDSRRVRDGSAAGGEHPCVFTAPGADDLLRDRSAWATQGEVDGRDG
ncbi:MAG: hypothetical protein J2P17_16090 [Mycobacterium sp.]|nr:hypothetical protein [Mycobacterium sp.]